MRTSSCSRSRTHAPIMSRTSSSAGDRLPGETLSVDDGQPIINGWRVPRCRVGEAMLTEPLVPTEKTKHEIFVEFLEGAPTSSRATTSEPISRRGLTRSP